jgi:hypothetical protein
MLDQAFAKLQDHGLEGGREGGREEEREGRVVRMCVQSLK